MSRTRNRFTRRALLGATTIAPALAAAPAPAREPIRLRLGIDTYTLRSLGWKAPEMLDYAGRMKLDVVQFSELPHLGSAQQVRDDSYLEAVRKQAKDLGIQIEMGTWGICPTNPGFRRDHGPAHEQLALAIHIAEKLGARSLRCVMGSGNLRREDGPLEKHVEATAGVFRAVRDQALKAGVKLALETHKDLRGSEMRDLVEAAGRDYAGVCLDTGNSMEVIEDPLDTLEATAPYVVTSHFRDSVLWKHPRGAAFQWTAMGDGSIGIERVVRRFEQLCPQVALNLEIITGRPPKILNYMEDEFWKGFENVPARDFARFLRLVENGHPLMAGMVVPNNAPGEPAYREAVKQQQRVDFERSVTYLREKLGVRWSGA